MLSREGRQDREIFKKDKIKQGVLRAAGWQLKDSKRELTGPRKNFDAESWESYGDGAYLLAGSEVIKLKL